MKYFLGILITLIFAGCIVDYNNPNSSPRAAFTLSNIIWTLDGNSIILLADSTASNGNYYHLIRVYDKTGTFIKSYNSPDISNYGVSSIWPSRDDSTIFYNDYFSSYGDILRRESFASGTGSVVAGGIIYAESADHNHLFIGPSRNQSLTNFLIMDVSGNTLRLQKNWSDMISQSADAVWMGDKDIGYFRYNDLNLIDFIIRDTNGMKLDSIDITYLMTGEQTFYAPGNFYFVGSGGILKIDSASKSNSSLTGTYIANADMASDGTFIVYYTYDSQISIINPKSGTAKKIADHTGQYMKISPGSNLLAYIDKSTPNFDKLVIIPVSAP